MKILSKPLPFKSRTRLQGSFLVEFSIIGVVFAMALAFCIDSVILLSTKGKLDRLAFSGVGLIKERSTLFSSGALEVSQSDFSKVDLILQGSLKRMISSFEASRYGIRLETWDPENEYQSKVNGRTCPAEEQLTGDMSVMTTWGRRAALYRVTLCYETDSWFATFKSGNNSVVSSSALMIGR